MSVVEGRRRTFRKATLLGLSFFIHISLLLILAMANLGLNKELPKKPRTRFIKVANLAKAKDKKTTKTKPKPKKKVVKTPKTKQKTKKSAKKLPRLAKAKAIKTTKLKKTRTKTQKTKLKIVKKIRLQAEKRTRKKQTKAETKPTAKPMEQKKIAEQKPRQTIKVVETKKNYTKQEKNLTRRKVTPKQVVTKMEFKTQKQKVQKLKRTVKVVQKDVTKPRLKPKVTPTQQVLQKKTVMKEIKLVKHFKPVRKTSDVTKKRLAKAVNKPTKKIVKKTDKNIHVREITQQQVTTPIATQKVRKQAVQKLTRVRESVKINQRVTKPRTVPKITQPQIVVQKQVVTEDVKQVRNFKPLRKTLTTQKTQTTPKVIKQQQVVRKHDSLLAVEKTKSAPTMTTATMEKIVPNKPQAVQEIAQVSRRQVATVVASSSTPVLQEKPMLVSAPAVQETKQSMVAETTTRTFEQPAQKAIEFEMEQKVTSSVTTPTQKAVTYEDQKMTNVSARAVSGPASDIVPVEEFSPETRSTATSNIASSARSATHVQNVFEQSVSANVDISQNEDLPISDQNKAFTQASITTDTGEEGDVESKIIQTERMSDGPAEVTQLAARASKEYDFRGIDPSAKPSDRKGGLGEDNLKVIIGKLPSGNMTNEQLYNLTGSVEGDIKGTFVTVNGNTQFAEVSDGQFAAEIALVKGINEISVMAFNSGGGVGKRDFKLLYTPSQGVPSIILESPPNGKQGANAGDPIIVEGSIDDNYITEAKLLLNSVPITLKVVNGRFRRKVFLPATRVNTFRIMATGRNGQTGYSSLHTVLIGYDLDIRNPRPY